MGPERPALERALAHALAHLEGLGVNAVGATATPEDLRRTLARPLPDRGTPAPQVIDELVADAAGGLMGSQGGRFFGWVIGGSLPASMAADWTLTPWPDKAIGDEQAASTP